MPEGNSQVADNRPRIKRRPKGRRTYPWRVPRAACVRDMKHCVCRRSASLIFFRSYFVIAGHSRSKNGVASLAYDPAIHAATKIPLSFGRCNSAWTTGSSPMVARRGGCLTLRLAKLGRERAARTVCVAPITRATVTESTKIGG